MDIDETALEVAQENCEGFEDLYMDFVSLLACPHICARIYANDLRAGWGGATCAKKIRIHPIRKNPQNPKLENIWFRVRGCWLDLCSFKDLRDCEERSYKRVLLKNCS